MSYFILQHETLGEINKNQAKLKKLPPPLKLCLQGELRALTVQLAATVWIQHGQQATLIDTPVLCLLAVAIRLNRTIRRGQVLSTFWPLNTKSSVW